MRDFDLRDAFRLPVKQCGNCENWAWRQAQTRNGYREAPCAKGVIVRDAPVSQENPYSHRGSDTCGKWEKVVKL